MYIAAITGTRDPTDYVSTLGGPREVASGRVRSSGFEAGSKWFLNMRVLPSTEY
jgi:hypothetical protein